MVSYDDLRLLQAYAHQAYELGRKDQLHWAAALKVIEDKVEQWLQEEVTRG